MADFKGKFDEVRRRGQGGAGSVKDLDSFKAAFGGADQELRRLPRDLSREEELIRDYDIDEGRPSM